VQSKKQTWFWLVVLLLFFIIISIFGNSQKPKVYPNYVSDSPSPSGVKAFYTYLHKEMEVKSWSYSPKMLPTGPEKKLLIMVEPSFVPDQVDMGEYKRFMEAGNTILLLKNNPKGMFDLQVTPIDANAPEKKALNVYDQNKKAYRAEINSSIRLLANKNEERLLYDNYGTVALKQTFGHGQLIVAIAPEWITNDQILSEDNLTLILHLLNESNTHTVLFDEYSHAGENTATMLNVYPKWFLLILLQIVFLTILWLWYKGKRFGPIFVPREETVRFSDEGIRALTAWYLKGRRYHDSFLIQADYVKLLLQERWKIPFSKEWKDLSPFLERKWLGVPKSDIGPFLNGVATMVEKEKMSKQEFLQWSRKLELLRKEVEEG
jgi:hypothetical protein